ncbi:phakinin isoform X1 [Antennarius striatus]|uniref:phakinin isoform X1 n=1 Tax=Antennarius striatus TaxID=241820 RepID=UPI0035B18D5F
MPLPRCRSSILGQLSSERPAGAPGGRVGSVAAAHRGVYVGSAPSAGGASCLGTRVSRRALGISSVFLQGLRSSVAPVVPRTLGPGGGSAGLSGGLMEYRDKVHALERLNQQLEQQIRLSLDGRVARAGEWGGLRREWEDVYRQVSQAILDNARLMLQTENVQANAEDFKERSEVTPAAHRSRIGVMLEYYGLSDEHLSPSCRYENEQPFRKAVEEEISSLYKVIDDADLTRAELEEQMENMRAELRSLELHHEQDVRVLYNQMAGREVDEPDAPLETSLDQILASIRSHWEKVTERNRAEAEGYLECKEAQGVSLSPEEQTLEALKAECHQTGCQIQSLQAETESIRALKRGLENSLGDARHWHDLELQNLGSLVAKLEAELADIRGEIEQQRHDYDTMLGHKQRLEQEIGTYHGLLDGEESRLQTGEAACPSVHSEPEGAVASDSGPPDTRTETPGPPGPDQ